MKNTLQRLAIVSAFCTPLLLCFGLNVDKPVDVILDRPETGGSFILASMAILVVSVEAIASSGNDKERV